MAARRWPEWNKVGVRHGKVAPLGLAVVTVLPPLGGVGVDVVPDAEIVRLTADDVVVVAALPDSFPTSYCNGPF